MSKKSTAETLLDSTWFQVSLLGLIGVVGYWFFQRQRQQETQDSSEPVIWRRDIEMGPVGTQQGQNTSEMQSQAWQDRTSARTPEMGPSVPGTGEAPAAEAEVQGPVEREGESEEETPAGDDLEIIEGIGPKINTILQEAGIRTFRQLAESDVEQLRRILRDAGLRTALSNPETWAEQAQLAADGDWSKLETLQNSLKAGRRG